MFSLKIDGDLELRSLEPYHAEQLFALTEQNRAYLREWLPWVDQTNSVLNTQQFIKNYLQQFAENKAFNAGIWFKNELTGVIGYHQIDWSNRKTSIGYWLGASFQGQGLMTKSCRFLVNYAFHELRLNRVEIRCATGNQKSRAIPEKLGFTQEGILRQTTWLNDQFLDLVVYAMLAHEWPQQNESYPSGSQHQK